MTSAQYNQLNELLSEYSAVSAAIEVAEGEIKTVQLAAARDLLPKHAEAQIKLTNLEAALRKFSDDHYADLFGTEEKRTHQTPFGGVKYHKSASLEFDDAEKVLLKIKLVCAQEAERAIREADHMPRFRAGDLIRTHEEPNLLAMDSMDDATLAIFGVTRKAKDNFKVVPFDMKSDKPAKAKKAKLQEAA